MRLVSQWESKLHEHHSTLPRQSRCAITLHHWYRKFDPAQINHCFSEIVALGAGIVRMDIRWMDIIPDGHTMDATAMAWYQGYIRTAIEHHGLRPLIVLSNPPENVLALKPTSRIIAWNRYIDIIASHFVKYCSEYQLMNELNNPVYRFLPFEHATEAISTAACILKAARPDTRIWFNVLADLFGWRRFLEKCIICLGSTIDVYGIDCYPHTWAIGISDPWSRLSREMANIIDSHPATRFAILETGYSTNIPFLRTERNQILFFKQLDKFARFLDSKSYLECVALFEISDQDSRTLLFDPEAHFGIIKVNPFSRKSSFETVMKTINAIDSRTIPTNVSLPSSSWC